MKPLLFAIWGIMLFSSCIGTDLIEETEVPEQVLISTNISSIKIGDEVLFEAIYTNKYGMAENKQVIWSTITPETVSVTPSGLIRALKAGDAVIKATAANAETTRIIKVSADPVIETGINTRSGIFMSAGSGSYTVTGDVMITTQNGKSKITVNDNFKASIGPSLFLLLTNHTNGSYMVVNNNPAINGTSAQISLNRLTNFQGAMSWDVPAGVDIKNYKYALLYCTLGPVFGFAELK
ncbi:MAG: DM13 domain-containing protein [Saprospiraceae bacterium]|nr:DM13 domain-containing protein [Saprospiraceae bacterium]MBP6569640.1 DM13 domain-containing protein [Saprospiraceae bacterium]